MMNYFSSSYMTLSYSPRDYRDIIQPDLLFSCPNMPSSEQQNKFFGTRVFLFYYNCALCNWKFIFTSLPIFSLDQSLLPISDYLSAHIAVIRIKANIIFLLLTIDIELQYMDLFQVRQYNIVKNMSQIKKQLYNQDNFDIKFEDEPQRMQKQVTLDEPVSKTLKRDLQMIIIKLRYAMIPSLRQTGRRQLLNWDLWGPFLLTLLLSCTLAFRTQKDASTIITSVFFTMWVGSLVVYLNANFLGSEMSFFQSACMLGYCLFPLNVVSFITMIIGNYIPSPIKLTLVGFSFIWATLSSIAFMGELVPQTKRKLALYPVCLFYIFLSWFVLIV